MLRESIETPMPSLISSIADSSERIAYAHFYRDFYERGLFDLNGRFDGVELPIKPPTNHLAGPLAVHLEIIGACNLACSHCFAGLLPRNQNPLQVREMETLFRDLAGMGSFRLGLTGGEPLIRKDLFDILDAATDNGLHPCLTTNGLLIDDDIARELGRRDLVWLNVSLDGASAKTNDAIRGHGTFEQVLDRLKVLRRHARFTLAFTITTLNAAEVQRCARVAAEVGADNAVFRPLYPVGTATGHPDLMPEYSQYVAALAELNEIELGDDIHAIDPFSPQSREESRSRVVMNNGCGAANTIASISVQGDVNPCSFLGAEFNCANIRDRSFSEIWNEGHSFVEMRQWSRTSNCDNCDDTRSDQFAGGCRARALVMAGDANARDPWHTEWEASRNAGSCQPHPLVNIEVHRER